MIGIICIWKINKLLLNSHAQKWSYSILDSCRIFLFNSAPKWKKGNQVSASRMWTENYALTILKVPSNKNFRLPSLGELDPFPNILHSLRVQRFLFSLLIRLFLQIPIRSCWGELSPAPRGFLRSLINRGSTEFEPRVNWVRFSERTFPASYTTVFLMCFEVKYRVVDGFSSRRNQQKK